jgi:hypothetical protein
VNTASSNVYRFHLHLREPHIYIIILFVRQKQKEDTNYSFLLMRTILHPWLYLWRNTDLASVMYIYYMHVDALFIFISLPLNTIACTISDGFFYRKS